MKLAYLPLLVIILLGAACNSTAPNNSPSLATPQQVQQSLLHDWLIAEQAQNETSATKISQVETGPLLDATKFALAAPPNSPQSALTYRFIPLVQSQIIVVNQNSYPLRATAIVNLDDLGYIEKSIVLLTKNTGEDWKIADIIQLIDQGQYGQSQSTSPSPSPTSKSTDPTTTVITPGSQIKSLDLQFKVDGSGYASLPSNSLLLPYGSLPDQTVAFVSAQAANPGHLTNGKFASSPYLDRPIAFIFYIGNLQNFKTNVTVTTPANYPTSAYAMSNGSELSLYTLEVDMTLTPASGQSCLIQPGENTSTSNKSPNVVAIPFPLAPGQYSQVQVHELLSVAVVDPPSGQILAIDAWTGFSMISTQPC